MGNQDVPKMMTMAINILLVLLVLASSSILFLADLKRKEMFNNLKLLDEVRDALHTCTPFTLYLLS